MENASKALLIAGAILLVIALIAIGMAILGQGQGVADLGGTTADSMKIAAHNALVTPYEGKITKQAAIDLVTKVESYNASTDKIVNITMTGVGSTLSALTGSSAKGSYNVTLSYDTSASSATYGLVTSLVIN